MKFLIYLLYRQTNKAFIEPAQFYAILTTIGLKSKGKHLEGTSMDHRLAAPELPNN